MFTSSSEPAPESWEPPVGAAIAEPMVPRLCAMFGLRACWYESFPFDPQLPRIEPGRIVLPAEEPGVASWAGEIGIELPVRHDGLTIGRYVLVPAQPTTGVEFPPTRRAEAIAMIAEVGPAIAAMMVAEGPDTPTPRPRPGLDRPIPRAGGSPGPTARPGSGR